MTSKVVCVRWVPVIGAAAAAGIAINCMSLNEVFCATGSDDGYLRLWPLDFRHVYLEAEHEGPVTALDIAADGLKIVAGTSTVRAPAAS